MNKRERDRKHIKNECKTFRRSRVKSVDSKYVQPINKALNRMLKQKC